jgi:hypothetical protein
MKSSKLKFLLNIYPPYWGTGIRVKNISSDYREALVQMKRRWYNTNYVKTHFGGSLYAMTDPFFMLMLIQILGKEYVVWDKSANIDFIKPGINTVSAKFLITNDHLQTIYDNTKEGQKYLHTFEVKVEDENNELVALVKKVLYIRKNNL